MPQSATPASRGALGASTCAWKIIGSRVAGATGAMSEFSRPRSDQGNPFKLAFGYMGYYEWMFFRSSSNIC